MEAGANTTVAELIDLEKVKYFPVTVVLVVIMFIGITGNSLVLIIYKWKFKQSSARVYILSLAITDLTVCVLGIPYHVLDMTLVLAYSNVILCKTFSYVIVGFSFSSIFLLTVVGLDRYLKVCRPLRRQIADFGDRKACLIAVSIGMVISIPNGIFYGHSSFRTGVNNITILECFIEEKYQGSGLAVGYLGFILLLCLSSVFLLIILYAFIIRIIYQSDATSDEISIGNSKRVCFCCLAEKHEEEGDENNDASQFDIVVINKPDDCSQRNTADARKLSSQNNGKPSNRGETMTRHSRRERTKEKNTRKITLMMMTITIVFTVAYLPVFIISILEGLDGTFWDNLSHTKAVSAELFLRLYILNNAANPVIYCFWDKKFRKETVKLLRNTFCFWHKR